MPSFVCMFCSVMLCLGFLSNAHAADVRLAVASNFRPAMLAIITEFEKASGNKVSASYGSSGKFYAQITHGAPFDVLFSADQTKPAALLTAGLAVVGSDFTYALGELALWSAHSNIASSGVGALRVGAFNKLALANPKLAPYGAAAVQVLNSLGLHELTQPKWVQGENIAQTFQFVSSGSAELGFVARSQLSQLEHAGQLKTDSVGSIPQSLYSPIQQDAVLLIRGRNNLAAKAFLIFVKSPKARAVIESYGYRVL